MSCRIWLGLMLVAASPLATAAAGDGAAGGGAGAGNGAGGAQPPAAANEAKDAEAAAYLKDLEPQIGKQADEDAKASITKLLAYWKDKDVTEATKKNIPKFLETYGRDDKKSVIAMQAVDALGELGADAGADRVRTLLDRALKAKEPSLDAYGSCLRALKKMADPKKATTSAIVDLLKFRMDDVVGKAADALGGYAKAPGKLRRELLEELIKNTEGTSSQAKDSKNVNQVHKWNIISAYVMSSLKALSGQQFKDVADARAWFNDHKKDKSWDS